VRRLSGRPNFYRTGMGIAFLVAMFVGAAFCASEAQDDSAQPDPAALALRQSLTLRQLESSIIEAIASAESSVVAIALVPSRSTGDRTNIELRPGPFGMSGVSPAELRPTDPDFLPARYGTGVIVDREGLVLTARHVLEDGYDYYVATSDRRVRRAHVKAADPRSDLAVLELETSARDSDDATFTPIQFGDASLLQKGQFVVALGNPHAIARDGQACASWGIISNLGRKLPPPIGASSAAEKDTLHHFGMLIQTDAKLNLGTSGGALLDLDGRMIGLTTCLASIAGYEQAAGYAIPVDEAFLRAVDMLRRGREVEYGFLGVQLDDLTLVERSKGMSGARVDRVVRGLPGARYGLMLDDVITAVNDSPIYDSDSLVSTVGRLPLEDPLSVSILRDGRTREFEMQLAKYPVPGRIATEETVPAWRGLSVDYSTVLDDLGAWRSLGLRYYDEGVLATSVEEDSPAAQAGLRVGMVVVRLGGRATGTPIEFTDAAQGIGEGTVTLECIDPSASGVRISLSIRPE